MSTAFPEADLEEVRSLRKFLSLIRVGSVENNRDALSLYDALRGGCHLHVEPQMVQGANVLAQAAGPPVRRRMRPPLPDRASSKAE